jgi:DtxR family transcriptional regulator, Mn-dependent transcriptional regulator
VSYPLALFALAIVLAGLVVWRRVRQRPQRERRRIEDALKHLFDQEYRGRRATLSSLCGVLRLPAAPVLALVARMQSLDLLRARGQEFDLTPDGERLALQVVRAHRLLERYFADEARLPLSKVHTAAEHREHTLSAEDVNRLSAELGHPAFDPHGDPIPTRDGIVPPAVGTPLTSWAPETTGRVVHLEDEPPIAFAQILAEGLRIGQVVRLIERTAERIVLTDGEHEFRLAPAVAANVFLAPAPDAAAAAGVITLAELEDHAAADVIGLDTACQGFSRRRLMDMGFTEGTRIRPVLRTLAGDPRAYQVRGTTVAVRRDQASQVLVRRVVTEKRETA